jgi:hypothetical protein
VYSTHVDDGRVTAVDKKTFEARLLATEPHALAVGVDATSVYFVTYEAEGRVWRAAKDGSGATLLAVGQAWPYAIAVDADAVYWANRGSLTNEVTDAHDAKDGQIMRLPKVAK